ncbi:MAG TPA: hypothetical protein VNE82_23570 [Candidatus Binataceae bacterium]|nr:hypothetical protein [Candidatus Binataceae bacterium]
MLQLLRGKDLEPVFRSLGVTAATLSQRREAFLAAGEAVLVSKSESGEALETGKLTGRLGQALIERELLDEKVAILEARRPFWPDGGRGHEPADLPGRRQALRPWLGVPGLAAGALRCLPALSLGTVRPCSRPRPACAVADGAPGPIHPGMSSPPACSMAKAIPRHGRACVTPATCHARH